MVNNPREYERMSESELQHWWYKSLHELTLTEIKKHFQGKDITIVDAGCGTGGLLLQLKNEGYKNCSGIDIAFHAIELAKHRNVDVIQDSILNINKYYAANSIDVIISHDVFYLDRKSVV